MTLLAIGAVGVEKALHRLSRAIDRSPMGLMPIVRRLPARGIE